MTRQQGLLAGLAVVVVGVLFFMFLWSPKNAEIAEIEAEIENVEDQQAQLRARIARLEELRAEAPRIEAQVVAAESVVPRDLALASATRQFVLAADESGAELISIAPGRPEQVEEAPPGFSRIDLSLNVNGGYFQIVDFLRRIEDPTITPRGVLWQSLTLAPAEYPTLAAGISGTMFAQLPAPPPEGEEPEDEAADNGDSPDDGATPADGNGAADEEGGQ